MSNTRSPGRWWTTLALALAACAPRAAPLPAPAAFADEVGAFYPLAVGNQWHYAGAMLGVRTTRAIEIVRSEGGVFYDNLGGALRLDGHGLRDDRRYLLRGPVERGTSWTSVTSVSAVERYEISAVGQEVRVAAGTFGGCVTVRAATRLTARRVLYNELTFAPRVGIVRLETYLLEDERQRIPQVALELQRYQLAPAG